MTASAREASQELIRRGDISWFCHPAQAKLLEWLDARRRELAVICISRQFGKTTLALAYAISYCIRNPQSNVLFVAPIRHQLKNYVLPKLSIVFQYLPDDLIPVRRDLTWQFGNGSTLRCEGVSVGRGQRLRGDTAHLVIMDECREIAGLQEMVDSSISPMLTTTNGRIVMISTPPDSPLHEFTAKYIAEAQNNNDFYKATYKENPLLSTKRLRYLLNTQYKGGEANPTFRREYMADYSIADDDSRVVKEWSQEENDAFFEDYSGPPLPVRMYIGLDFGFVDPCGILAGYYDYVNGCLVIEEEYMARGMNTDDVALKVSELEKNMRARHRGVVEEVYRVMDIDPALMQDLYVRGLRFEASHKVPSIVVMLNRLKIAILEGKIRVHPRCVQLCFQLTAGAFNSKKTSYQRTPQGGHLDLLDALKYLVLNMRWHEILKPSEAPMKDGQMWVGGFQMPTSFRAGIQRPR